MIYCCSGSDVGKVSVPVPAPVPFSDLDPNPIPETRTVSDPEPIPLRQKLRFLTAVPVPQYGKGEQNENNKKYLPPPITGWHIPAEFDCKYETSDTGDKKERSYVAFSQLMLNV
jgi:hypothetical protein